MATLHMLPHLAVIILSASVTAPLETGGIHLPAHRPTVATTQQPGAAASPAKVPQAPGGMGTVSTTTGVSHAYFAPPRQYRIAAAP